jgi:aminoglycoside phosphotransferase (APT) family kinase protein
VPHLQARGQLRRHPEHRHDIATEARDAALAATPSDAPVWFHGDVASCNLLVDGHGRLAAVLDFGTCGVGDPACDLVIAWMLLHGGSRETFRSLTPADAAMWARARGWALWKGLITIDSRPATADVAIEAARVVDDVLAVHVLVRMPQRAVPDGADQSDRSRRA